MPNTYLDPNLFQKKLNHSVYPIILQSWPVQDNLRLGIRKGGIVPASQKDEAFLEHLG
jgi:hypothetical protein